MASNTSIKTKFSKGIDLGGEEVINVTAIRHAQGANGQIVLDGDLSVTGTFSLPANGDLIPSSNNSQQVGQSVLRWANAHVANVYSDHISVGNTVTSSLIPGTNSEAFGNTSKVWTVFSDEVQVRAATPKIFMREGTTGNNYRMSVTSGQFKLDRVDASDANPTSVLYAENDGTVVFNNDIRVSGNLQVDGAQLVINVASLQLEDTFLVLNKNHTGAATANAGITINRGSDANVQIMWNETVGTDGQWEFTGNYGIVYIAGSPGDFVLEVANNDTTFGQSVTAIGNTVIKGSGHLRFNSGSNANSQIQWNNGGNINAIEGQGNNSIIGIRYSNTTFDRIATVDRDARSYDLVALANTTINNGRLRLSDDNNSNDTITFVGTGDTVVSSNASHIIINSTDNNDNTTYDLVAVANTTNNNGRIRLTGSDATSDTVTLVGTGATVVSSNATHVIINSSDTSTTYSVSIPTTTTKLRLTGSDSTTDDIEFVGSGATTVTRTNDSKFTISSTDNNDNTLYDLSTGGVNASVANLNLTASGSGTGTDVVRFVGSGLVTVSSNATHIIATGATPSLDAVLGVGNTTTKDISVRNLTSTGNTTLGNANSDIITPFGYFANSIIPSANNAYDLGKSTAVWRNIYTGDLNMSNMDGDPNEVDGTKGSWSIQEGEDDLFLINKRNGKKYKFKLEEVK